MVPDLKAVRETMKKFEEEKQRGFLGEMRANQQDLDKELAQRKYEERAEKMKDSLEFIEGMIAAAESADPRLRKQQMFGGDAKKELAYNKHQEELKEHFIKRIYNLTQCK